MSEDGYSSATSDNEDAGWRSSKAKEQLMADLQSGYVPLDRMEMMPKVVYQLREEYRTVSYETFRNNLNRLRNKYNEEQKFSTADAKGLARDRLLHPTAPCNQRGIPRWEGSDAQKFLKADMDQQWFTTKEERKALYKSRKEYYKNFPFKIFYKHVDQEERLRKFKAYLKDKSEKEQKKREKAREKARREKEARKEKKRKKKEKAEQEKSKYQKW
jgi:hypothetical protein